MKPGMTECVVVSPNTSIDELKADLRREVFARRDAMPAAERQAAAETIAQRPFPLPIRPGVVVSGFSPIRTEINPLLLLRRLAAVGAKLALPVIAGKGKPLIMRTYAFGDPLEARTWGIVVTWDLAQLVYSREEGQLALAHQHLARVRREVAVQAAKLWSDRRRKCAALERLSGPLRREAVLDLLRITAELDALTGGLYREAVKDAEQQLAEEEP